jgi:hypothetical protein
MTIEQALILAAVCSLSVGGLVLFLTYQRWYLPLRTRLKVERLRHEEAVGIPPSPRDYNYKVDFNSDGFTLADLRGKKHESFTMPWIEVLRVTAFKRDLLTLDRVCLFLARADGKGVELHEDMAGWSSFAEALPEYLPGCKPTSEWFPAVALPAFAPNQTEIYDRNKAQPPIKPVGVKGRSSP